LNEISGEIFISIDRVRENASEFQQSFEVEIRRVMIHGLLHLCGYNDKTTKEKSLMFERENFYLDSFS
jgi:rRNA maturation RNase YbeY